MNEQSRNALAVLAKAAELYVGGLDELARAFATPQIQSAVAILQAALMAQPEELKDDVV